MARTTTLTPEQVPADSKPTLDAFIKNIGFTPNMMSSFAQSPIAFNAWATPARFAEQSTRREDADSIGLVVSESERLQLLPDGAQLYRRAYGEAAGR